MDWNGRNDIKFIQIKWEEEESSYKKRENDEESVMAKYRVVGEVKRQRGKRKIGGNVRHVQIKWEEEESNYEKWWRKCNGEVESSGASKEAKREMKGWRKCNYRCGLIGRRRYFCFCSFRE